MAIKNWIGGFNKKTIHVSKKEGDGRTDGRTPPTVPCRAVPCRDVPSSDVGCRMVVVALHRVE